ncbi:hypothetical protein MHU86_9202 [Fragilaria crotonensis]|nr:hypothetical protein MHU86_9202 [Fragilaria crotonensis]
MASLKDFGLDPGLEVMLVERPERCLGLDSVQPKAPSRRPLSATHLGSAMAWHSFAQTASLTDFGLDVMSAKSLGRRLGLDSVQPKVRLTQPLSATRWGLAMGWHSFALMASLKDFRLGISLDVMSAKSLERHSALDLVQPKAPSRQPLSATHWGLAMGWHSFALTASLKDFGLDVMSAKSLGRRLGLDSVQPKAPSTRPPSATHLGSAMGWHSFALTANLKDVRLNPRLEVMSAKR